MSKEIIFKEICDCDICKDTCYLSQVKLIGPFTICLCCLDKFLNSVIGYKALENYITAKRYKPVTNKPDLTLENLEKFIAKQNQK